MENKPLRPAIAVLEIGFILLAIWLFTPQYQDFSPATSISGLEYPMLASSGEVASIVLKKTGAIPLWDPFIGYGEPLLESLFSFTLNPLMSVPILWLGAAAGGKLALLLHIVLMGLGGWTLGRVLGLESAGRVLLGLLLAGSGSVAAAIGAGYYQLGLSQIYVPWIIAGLIGTLHERQRWPICMLAVFTMLMIFAGTFWYILPTMIVAAALTLFEIASRRVGRDGLMRLAWAVALTVGLSFIRLLPLIHLNLYTHPTEPLAHVFSLLDIIRSYVRPYTPPDAPIYFNYHYILPAAFIALLAIGQVWVVWRSKRDQEGARRDTTRIIIPALLFVLVFSVWAEEGTPFLRWLYTAIPLLAQWRDPARMGAVANVWLVVVAAICFDGIITMLWRAALDKKLNSKIAYVALAVFVIAGLVSSLEILANWIFVSRVEEIYRTPGEPEALTYLRLQYPTDFLSVATNGIFHPFTFYTTLERAATGNPNAFASGVSSSIGNDTILDEWPEYAIGVSDGFQAKLAGVGYVPVVDGPRMSGNYTLFFRAAAPPYTFWIPRSRLESQQGPLTRDETHVVFDFTHNLNNIRVAVGSHDPDAVLVVQDAAYPGWTVTVNGQAADVQSVGKRLGVLLPDTPSGAITTVVFTYRPTMLYIGALISVLSIVVFIAYALRLDRFWRFKHARPPT